MRDLSYYNWKIRNSIIPEEKIKEYLYLGNNTLEDLNCYAYAMGAAFPCLKEYNLQLYTPGFSEGKDWIMAENNKELIELLTLDFENLNITYRFVNLDEKNLILKPREYLVKFYRTVEKSVVNDFHFIRKSNKDGFWYHKQGWSSGIEKTGGYITYNSRIRKGMELNEFTIDDGWGKVIYSPVTYIVLSY